MLPFLRCHLGRRVISRAGMSISLWEYLSRRTEAMAERALSGVETLKDWEKLRPARLREFGYALGIGELPPRCDLKLTEYGEFSGEGYRARKIGFQILPDCWTSAAIYYPEPRDTGAKYPAILYVCGHAPNGIHGYQAHAVRWVRRGYVCMVVDTIEQADNPGEHHGHSCGVHKEWLSRGYSPAGGETWNSIRALDVLEADPAVDAERIGVTGQSGGGAISFYLAAIDDRVKVLSSLCGVSTPVDGVKNRHLAGHCDCFYPLNLFIRDWSEYAALIAPRPAIFCFGDHDPLFHPVETAAFVERTRRVYALYGVEDNCRLVTSPGPHGSLPRFCEETQELFDAHLAGESRPHIALGKAEVSETETSVFRGLPPQPNYLDLLPRLLLPVGRVALPDNADDWQRIRREALGRLPFSADDGSPGEMWLDGDWRFGAGTAVRAHRGRVADMDIWLHALNPETCAPRLIISVAGAGEFSQEAMCAVAVSTPRGVAAYGGFEPRASGNNLPVDVPEVSPPGSRLHSARLLLQRAFTLAGLSPVLMTIQDLRVLLDYVSGLEEMRGYEIYLHGRGDAAVAVLYRALLDERVKGVFLEEIPHTHAIGGVIPGILQCFDIPQAVGLMAPRLVALVRPGHGFWHYANSVYGRLGCSEKLIHVDILRHAIQQAFS